MINNQEFRIGNYILVNNIPRKICSIENENGSLQPPCVGYEQNNECNYEISDSETVKAVTLTDQVLRDLGFVFHDYFKLWQHKRPDKSYIIELDSEYSALDFAHRPIVKNIKYLHQLQNLFFCIQGEELFFETSNPGPGRRQAGTRIAQRMKV